MQAYVIATSTQVEISKVDVSKFDDAYFKSSDKAQKKKGEEAFFEEKTEKKKLSSDYIDNQKKVGYYRFSYSLHWHTWAWLLVTPHHCIHSSCLLAYLN